jgi:drug/metabolite transporter (DMT)-like permease
MRTPTALFALHIAVALFGFAALFGKWIALAPDEIVFGRTVVAATTLFIVARWRSSAIGRPGAAVIANGALLALHWVAFFAAVQVASVAIALLGFASFPVFVVVLERMLEGRRPAPSEWLAVALVVAGLALLVPELAWASGTVRGLGWGIVSGFTFALLALRNRSLVRDTNPIALALWQNAFAAFWLLPLIAVTGDIAAWTPTDVALIVLLGVVCTALAHTLFIASMLRVTAHTASIVSILEPVYGIALAAVLLGQQPDVRTLAGGALILLAALLATMRAARQ